LGAIVFTGDTGSTGAIGPPGTLNLIVCCLVHCCLWVAVSRSVCLSKPFPSSRANIFIVWFHVVDVGASWWQQEISFSVPNYW